MAILRDIKFFQAGGMNSDDAVEYRPKNDYFPAYNIRTMGTQSLEEGYVTNVESNQLLSASVPPGISRCIGSAGFESARMVLEFYYNSASYNQIRQIDYDTNEVTPIDIRFWPLNPQHYVTDIKLINNEFLCFNDNYNPPAYVNFNRLKSGQIKSYNDMLLIKRQPYVVAKAQYSDDPSRNVNLLNNKWFQFRSQYIGLDYEQSVDSTISELFIPSQSPTPEGTTDVTKNNNLIIQVDAGDESTSQVVIDARYQNLLWFTILTMNRSDILNLPTTINIPIQQYLAYDPTTNLLTFVFYNDGLYVNKPALKTDQLYDAVPLKAGAMTVLNGNELILGDLTTGYDRPNVPATLSVTNYNPNLTQPPTNTNPINRTIINPGMSGSGLGNHKRLVVIEFGGVVQTNDTVTITLVDIRNSSNTLSYTFTCTLADNGNTFQFITDSAPSIPNSSTYTPTDGNAVGINIVTQPYFTLQSCTITLYNAGSGYFKSIHALKTNSAYQVMLAIYDYWGRPFPLQDLGIVKTNSYAQSHGQTPEINWTLLAANAPAGGYTYQFVLSKNTTHLSELDMIASVLAYQGTWNAHTNTPTLSPNDTSTIGHVFQITTPNLTTDTSLNLGNGVQTYNSGDYVVNNGTYWFILPASYGNLASPTDYYFYLNALHLFNTKNNSSILEYGFTDGDRCTVYYSQTPGVGNAKTWYDGVTNPVIDLQVQSYDPANFLLRVNALASVPPSTFNGLDVLIEIYTPAKQPQQVSETVLFETGQVYNIVNGQFQTLSGVITQGDVYFKSREIQSSLQPSTTQYSIAVEDNNYTDFFPSAYTSYGRPRSYNDVLETTRKIATLIYSDIYVIGSKVNGLTRFHPENVYGDNGGETSSNYGAIVKMEQINNELLFVQEENHGTIPVFINILEDQAEQQNVAISEKILNNARYTMGKHIGIGNGRRSFSVYNNIVYWIDSNRNEPIRWAQNGAIPISGKMSKYFRNALQVAYAAGLEPIGWYDIYNDEYVISIPQLGGIVQNFAFSAANWQYLQPFSVLPGEITLVTSPLHSSPSYNNITGICVITPSTNYVGTDSFKIAFPESPSTVNICYNWTAGNSTVNAFSFLPQTGVPLSTLIQSNTISVIGNDFPVPISISGSPGAAYSVNGGAFTSALGTVNAGDVVQVEVLSSGSTNTLTSATLTIDGQSATFNVTTRTSTGHFTATAQYNMQIQSVLNGSGSGVPAGYNPCNLNTNGSSLTAAYTTLTAGTYQMVLNGMPAIPGHTYAALQVNSVLIDSKPITGSGTYTLTLGSPANDPDVVVFTIITM